MYIRHFVVCTLLVLSGLPFMVMAQPVPSISLDMRLVEDTGADICGLNDNLVVGAGATVRVCYAVTNTGQTTLNLHDVVDDQLGTLLSGFALQLDPGITVNITTTAVVNADTTFTGTWTAYNSGPVNVAQATDSATVTVIPPTISLDIRLVEDTGVEICGLSDSLAVHAGATVRVCYAVTNTGQTTLNLHDVVDDQLGTLLSGFALQLDPGITVNITATTVVNADTTFTGTWTAYNSGPVNVAQATDSAPVTIVYAQIPTLGFKTLLLLAGLLTMVAFSYLRRMSLNR